MSVELDPPELGFRRPFTHEVTQVLKLTNPNDDPVAFKVKTTAPKQYCVRPNSGSIEPGKSVEVQVLLQAMKEDPPLDAKCRDKFLVQSVAIDAEQAKNDSNVWANLDKLAKDSIKEKKIRVSFLPARGDSSAAAVTNGTSHEAAPPAYAPPTPPSAATSPTTNHSAAPQTARDFSTPSKNDSSFSPSTTTGSGSGAPVSEQAADLYNSAAASVSAAASKAGETLQQQLDNANETIISLKEQIQSQNLRQRAQASASSSGSDVKDRSTTGSSSNSMAMQQHSSDGVPVQMVAGLCLLSFLIAYLFF